MNNIEQSNNTGEFSMRRTFLTLLGAFAAFGILTASYATAELPSPATTPNQTIVVE